MSNALSKYGQYTEDDATREEEEQESLRGPSVFLRLDPDTAKVVRAIPSKDGPAENWLKFWKHTYTDPLTGEFVSFICCDQKYQKNCPACRQAQRLIASRSEVDKKFGFKMKAKRKAFMRVFERPTEKDIENAINEGLEPPEGFERLWEISSWAGKKNGKNMHEELLALLKNPRIGGNFWDPGPEGCDLLIERHGEKMSTRYKVFCLRDKDERRPLAKDEATALRLIEEPEIEMATYAVPLTEDEAVAFMQGGKPKEDRRAISDGRRTAVRPDAVIPRSSGRSVGDYVDEDLDGSGGVDVF